MLRKLVLVVTAIVLFAAAQVQALGLGDIVVESALNQPLAARIELLQLGGVRADQIRVRLASANDFERFSVERAPILNSIRFNIQSAGDGIHVSLTTVAAVREPYLSFVLETTWPSGRLLSEHTILLDLPSFAANSQAAPIQQPVQDRSRNLPVNTVNNQSNASQTSDFSSGNSSVLSSQNEPTIPQSGQDPDGATISVGADDTLWDIALQIRPDRSVSVQQTMLALQRLNRDAFISDNINMVRRGQVLRVPDLEQIRALSNGDAVSEVARQNQLFENRFNAPLTSQPVAAQSSTTAIDTFANRGELSVVTPDADDSISVQGTSGGVNAELDDRVTGLENELAVQQEEADRIAVQNRELEERLRLLEQQIASAQEIIRLRDIELAQLQQALTQAPAVEPAAESIDPPAEVAMTQESGFFRAVLNTLADNTFVLLAVIALVILILVSALLRRNRIGEEHALADIERMDSRSTAIAAAGVERSEFASHRSMPLTATRNDAFDFAGEARSPRETRKVEGDVGTESDGGHAEDNAIADLLEEADVLIAHEQYDEAAAILGDAILVGPGRTDLRLKLLEVYVSRHDPIGFAKQESELRELADEEVLARIAALKVQLSSELEDEIQEEGEEDFFSELSSFDDVEAELDLNVHEETANDDDKLVDLALADEEKDEHLLDFDFDFSATGDREIAAVEESGIESTMTNNDPDRSVDFDLELNDEFSDEAEDDNAFGLLSDTEEAATKLDLARAYFEMGDTEGAREILEKILMYGTESQIADARLLLDKL